jgi:multidrug resistance efflux pump
MSAHKRASISLTAEDYRRLEEASKRLRKVEDNYQGLKEQLRAQQRAERSQGLWEAYQEVAGRQTHFQDSLQGVDASLQEMEAQAGQALLEHVGALHQEVDQLGENLWQNAAAVLEEQTGR